MKTEIPSNPVAGIGTSQLQIGLAPQAQFPVQADISRGESGQGYALRMAVENGVGGLPVLKSWLGKSRFAVLDAADGDSLARWFGANSLLLSQALGEVALKSATNGYRFGGVDLDRSYFVNRAYPRICPDCLAEHHMCLQFWEISIVTACHRHGALLVDSCSTCNRRLSWNRPALGTCSCIRQLGRVPGQQGPTLLELEIAAWAEARLLNDEVVRGETPLSRLILPLTLNGGLHLVHALATAALYDSAIQSRGTRHRSSLAFARETLVVASQILERLQGDETVNLRIAVPQVVLHLLAESASSGASSDERSLAHSLISVLLKLKTRSRSSSDFPQLSQLNLF